MTKTIALLGAGGKMGTRITDQIKDDGDYEIDYVEPGSDGQARLAERGISPTSLEDAIDGADVVIMAVPDHEMNAIAAEVVPLVDPGTMIMLLDPAAAYADALPDRSDIVYFISHPCHPPLLKPDRPPEYADDWFGGNGRAEQDIVCALHSGPENEYAVGEAIARDIYAPVRRSHRLTTQQMALLEPALAETLAATLVDVIHEGMEDIVEKGVPEQAAYDFLMGHLRIEIAIIFGLAGFPFSDAAREKIEEAREEILADNWRQVLSIDRTQTSVKDIAGLDG